MSRTGACRSYRCQKPTSPSRGSEVTASGAPSTTAGRIGRSVCIHWKSSSPCEPNARWFVKRDFMRMSHKKHPGWSRLYARVLAEGKVRPGDSVTVEEDN